MKNNPELQKKSNLPTEEIKEGQGRAFDATKYQEKEQTSASRHKENVVWVRYTTLGIELAVAMALCVLVGVGLDKWMEMSFPLFTLIGAFVGLFAVIARLVRISKQM